MKQQIRRLSCLFAALVSLTLWVSVARAQTCPQWEAAQAHLAERYGEYRTAMGVMTDGNLLIILTTPEGTTWTALVVSPGGTACMVAAGGTWLGDRPEPPAETEDG